MYSFDKDLWHVSRSQSGNGQQIEGREFHSGKYNNSM